MLKFRIYLVFMFPLPLFSNGFVVGNLQGQLGNQMFIIAATEAYARKNGLESFYPGFHTKESKWNISKNREKIFFRIESKKPTEEITSIYKEPYFHYSEIPYKKNIELSGYFQSEKYFSSFKEEVKALFAPSKEIVTYLESKYADILNHPNTVAIHFRDYSKEDPKQTLHPNQKLAYYLEAIKKFPEDSQFVVFSNNISSCKWGFKKVLKNVRFIRKEHFHHDFYLMSMCKHNIISNSSFSWWAAYLNKNPDKIVVAPKKWFGKDFISDTEDLIPGDWKVIN